LHNHHSRLFGIALGSCITLPCHKPYLVTACADLSSCLHPPVASAWISRTALPWPVESIVRSVMCFCADHSMHDEAYDDATQKEMTNVYSADGVCLITRRQPTRSITILNDTEPYAPIKHKIAGQSSIQMVRRRCLPRAPRRLTPILLAAETLAGRVPCAYQPTTASL
jgi:hypothetical protein